jgi:hypothetical protein
MKVNSYTPITQVMAKVTDKTSDKQGGAGSNAFERQQKKENEEKEFEPTLEAVEAAIETFAGDETNLSHGITASAQGTGPGLKVVLKDASGGVLRAVSGEEFLKLREAVISGQRSGRILDQKA